MSTPAACHVLSFLYANVRDGLDNLASARAFVDRLEDLDEVERLFLEAALSKRRRLEEFHVCFVSQPNNRPHPRRDRGVPRRTTAG